jgi:hypothetical protein
VSQSTMESLCSSGACADTSAYRLAEPVKELVWILLGRGGYFDKSQSALRYRHGSFEKVRSAALGVV